MEYHEDDQSGDEFDAYLYGVGPEYQKKRKVMNFQEYQAEASKTAIYPNKGNNLYYPTLGLCGEAGEVAEKIKKIMRDNGGEISIEKSAEIMKEIGDVLWYIAALCEELDIDMETCAILNIEKLRDRQARGTIMGSGDDR